MELSKDLYYKLCSLKDKNGNNVELNQVESVVSDLILLFKTHCNKYDSQLFEEIKAIGDTAHSAKMDFNDGKKDNVIESASSELDAVIESTEQATDTILDSAENIQKIILNSPENEVSKGITDNVMIIFEACNFQDITGQRIKKISKALDFIEHSAGHILSKYSYEDINKDERGDAHLMKGPGSNQDSPNQDDIDKLFDSV
ncbi:MAG: protein phosphatase CheZ [Rickettsiales bacterium]|nr:protein phosphatase CheZ [Pseudomonadota bacterium]MDA0965502.1 protein phosphatase CheZ [Pseudomonadota bacterium]MDG4542826.1 protein phosphatase CheZ [Rickettsiales bacterium]MDG4544726.1 protein phosphatase CheZ [Rickettsiales bacterium]MDG4546848.1 protein phosphatase CheZ [Rickettsiales bacterium]